MPTGIPRLGQAVINEHNSKLEEQFPGGEVLGELKSRPAPSAVWNDEELAVQIAMEQGPPPWEISRNGDRQSSDARNFIDCPKDWELRWINPRLLNQEGWRGWAPVRAKDPRVTVKVQSMVSPEFQIRRGSHDGDILSYMPKHWFEQRKQEYYRMVARRTQASVDKTAGLANEVRNIHPGITVDRAIHPTHTMGLIDRDAP